ncbi:alanine:cation symporter family protein [Shigella flexneri]
MPKREITNGFQRSMFSNEAGMDSTPNAAAAAASCLRIRQLKGLSR